MSKYRRHLDDLPAHTNFLLHLEVQYCEQSQQMIPSHIAHLWSEVKQQMVLCQEQHHHVFFHTQTYMHNKQQYKLRGH
jgi:hypothetical protein